MTDLTEQWKKGELPEGFYYIKVKEVMANYPLLANCVEGLSYTYFLDYEDYVTEVLAPVPSYEEYAMTKDCVKTVFEAAQRETILKEAIELIKKGLQETIEGYRMTPISRAELLLKELNEVLK